MRHDLILQLGELALASRFRRLSDRLMRDVSRVYRERSLDFEARWFPLLYLLGQRSPLPVGAVARELCITHPAVHQIAGAMTRKGLLVSTKDDHDDRRRLLALTPRGRALVAALEPLWQEIAGATREALDASGHDILGALAALEAQLDREEVYDRIQRRLQTRALAAVEILAYDPAYRRHFKSLNLEWLRKDFTVERIDREMLDDPEGTILDRGGAILFAREGKRIVGTCALLRHDAHTFELAKMAVAPQARGRQIGRRLGMAAIEKARALGATRLVLLTSPKLVPAVQLYRSLGFTVDSKNQGSAARYARPTFAMKLDLARRPARPRARRKAS
jgi:GNAT superfamily N-acetyltransferase/DNA-binding MarR family transcriptional regulator